MIKILRESAGNFEYDQDTFFTELDYEDRCGYIYSLPYEDQAEFFCYITGTEVKIDEEDRHVVRSRRGKTKYLCRYTVTVTHKGISITFPFYGTVGDNPTVYDVLPALSSNSSCGVFSFEDFCREYGYNEYDDCGRENKRAFDIWKSCQNMQRKLESLDYTDDEIDVLKCIR